MRILITGATGLVGSHITDICHKRKIDVNYLTTSKDKIENQDFYQGYFWDPSKNEIDEECLNGVDAIIHLAGATIAQRWTKEAKKEILDSRIGTANLLFKTLQASNFKIPHFISASAIGIYPSSLQNLYSEESDAVSESFLGETVVKWEAAANKFKELGMKVSKVRIGLVLAKNGGALPKLKDPVTLNLGTGLGSGKQWQSWIHIEDLAKIFLFVQQHELEGIFNGVAPNPVTNKELIDGIATQLHKSVWLPNVPAVALKAVLGDMATVVLSSQLVSADKICEAGFDFDYKNISKALQDLIQ